jgi:hypothetical protein
MESYITFGVVIEQYFILGVRRLELLGTLLQ